MDSNDSEDTRVEHAAAAEERSRPEGHAPQAAGGVVAGRGCHSNTRGESSLLLVEGYPEFWIAGGVDWFQWWALVHWERPERFKVAAQLIAKAKQSCQKLEAAYQEIDLPDFGPVRVSRVGFNFGGERGQHFEYSLRIPGVKIGVSSRNIERTITPQQQTKVAPNFVAKQTGRDALLFGAAEGFETAEALIEALGGICILKRISRGDLCLDIVNLDVQELLALVMAKQVITQARGIHPYIELLTG